MAVTGMLMAAADLETFLNSRLSGPRWAWSRCCWQMAGCWCWPNVPRHAVRASAGGRACGFSAASLVLWLAASPGRHVADRGGLIIDGRT